MKVSKRGRDGRIWGVGYKWEGAEEEVLRNRRGERGR